MNYGLRIGFLFASLTAFAGVALADSLKATAVLENSEAIIGQMVQMQIKVTGLRNPDAPETIAADGLEIRRTGQSYESRFSFGTGANGSSSSVIFSYRIFATKAGTFKIPSQTIRDGGTTLHTEELTLHVAGGSVGGSNSSTQNQNPGNGSAAAGVGSKLAYAELVIPKKVAYVGEVIPAVLRVGFFVNVQSFQAPDIKAQGFTIQQLQQTGKPQEGTIDGRRCILLTFKTAISPTRPGKFDIGPAQMTSMIVVPRQRSRSSSNRSRDPFDMDDMDDAFSDPFGIIGQRQELTVSSEPVELEVKPLPGNAPSNFAGAVGNFSMTVDAGPKTVQTGDPITVTATITGRGNFDRVSPPALEDERGWHKYPPSSKFKQDDDVGISGAKTIEMVFSPNEKKQTIAPFLFSYFDPATEKYATLRSEPIPIHVEGAAVAPVAATPAPNANASTPSTASAPASATPTATAAAKPQDILYQLNERPRSAQSFTPLYARRPFWLVQLIPLVFFCGLVSWRIRQKRRGNRQAQRVAALQEEAAELLRKLRREEGSPRDYLSQASRVIQVKTALLKNVDPNAVDAEAAATAFRLDENSRKRLRALFDQSDEMRYSGAANGGVSPETKRDVLQLIGNLRT